MIARRWAFLGRLAAGLLLLGVVLLFTLAVVLPVIREYDAYNDAADQLRSTLGRNLEVERRIAELKARLAELRKNQAYQPEFLHGANESLAAAQLQSRIKTVVESVRGELKSTQIVPGRDEGKFRRIIVRAQMVVSTPALQRIVYEVESASPLLFLDNVDVRAQPASTRIRKVEATEDPVLDVRFDIFGYIRQET
jgi:general secretion pathway protein M